jgi:hypothetical protein
MTNEIPIFVKKNRYSMKTSKSYLAFLAVISVFIITSCSSPITMTSWKNPANTTQISKVVVMPLFEKLEYLKPFEQSMSTYFNSKGLKSMGSLEIFNPNIKYPIDDIKRKCDSLGVDGILVFIYKGADKTESYVPQTTYYTGGYGGYWGGGYWGGGYYGGGVTTTGGYWTSTTTINLTANLYVKGSKEPLYTSEIQVTDPQYIDQVAATIAGYIYGDWQKNNVMKSVATGK